MKAYLAKNGINFYIINATKIAAELGLGSRTNTIMRSAFFKIANVIPFERRPSRDEARHPTVLRQEGRGYRQYELRGGRCRRRRRPRRSRCRPVGLDRGPRLRAHRMPHAPSSCALDRRSDQRAEGRQPARLSAFNGREDGTWDNGTAAWEKRGIAVNVPEWQIENCIQCNQCAYVCPHAAIRPFLATEEEAAASGLEWKQGLGRDEGLQVPHSGIAARLYGLQQLRRRLPREDEGPRDEAARDADEAGRELDLRHREDRLQGGRRQDQVGEEPAVRAAAVRVLGCLRRLRRDALHQGHFAALRRQDDGGQRHGLHLDLLGVRPSTPYCTNAKGQGPAWANSASSRTMPSSVWVCTSAWRSSATAFRRRWRRLSPSAPSAPTELKGAMKEWIAAPRLVGQVGRGDGPSASAAGGLRLRLLPQDPRNERIGS